MNDRLDDAIRSATADIVASAPSPAAGPVRAAVRRRKVPFWALPTLALMPIFAFMYMRALTSGAAVEQGPLSRGSDVYAKCASCHGATGGGVDGQGYRFSAGEVLATFPAIDDQVRFVYYGTDRYELAGVDSYGDPNRPGGPHLAGERGAMPPFDTELSLDEIVAVVCHERYTLGGADPTSDSYADEYTTWCAGDAPAYRAIVAGEVDLIDTAETVVALAGTDVVIAPIGTAPIAGRSQP